jgi:amino-acid N-acetyltransferase
MARRSILLSVAKVEARHGGAVAEIFARLDTAGLPTRGLVDDETILLTALGDEGLLGAAAVERYEADGLLRSVVVARSPRGEGIGRRLVASAESTAGEAGVCSLYLLTEGADAFFAQLGYWRVDRAEVPPAVQRSEEYSVLCPVDATVMMKRLNG